MLKCGTGRKQRYLEDLFLSRVWIDKLWVRLDEGGCSVFGSLEKVEGESDGQYLNKMESSA